MAGFLCQWVNQGPYGLLPLNILCMLMKCLPMIASVKYPKFDYLFNLLCFVDPLCVFSWTQRLTF